MNGQALAWLETDTGERIPLRTTCTIGRGPGNSLVLATEKASRHHALIHAQNETEFWLVDLGSRNGTFHNTIRIKQPTRLRTGDKIEVGSVNLTFRVDHKQADLSPSDSVSETVVTTRDTEVWLFLIDAVGFTQLCQTLPADELGQRLGSWLRCCAEIVEQSAGCVDKYVGDGFLAYWPTDKTSGAALKGNLDKIDALRTEDSLKFRWCLHRTRLQLGTSRFGNESLIGPEINFIHRMEKLAGSLNAERILSKPAVDDLRSLLRIRSVGQHHLKGFEEAYSFYTF